MAMTNYILNCYTSYKEFCKSIDELNKSRLKTDKKEIRPNFPEAISESICKILFDGKYLKGGDMKTKDGRRVEIKAFSSKGPTSFGPTEKWDIILFLDLTQDPNIIIYKCEFSSESKEWNEIKISKTQTYEHQCRQGRRPRISFESLKTQIHFEKIFEGNIVDVLNNKMKIIKI